MTINYVVPFKENGIQIPMRIQSRLAKDFCRAKNLSFSLPITESWDNKTYRELNKVLAEEQKDIIIYSHLLIANKIAREILKRNEQSCNNTAFHITYQSQTLTFKELLGEIDAKLRHKKFTLSCNQILYKYYDGLRLNELA